MKERWLLAEAMRAGVLLQIYDSTELALHSALSLAFVCNFRKTVGEWKSGLKINLKGFFYNVSIEWMIQWLICHDNKFFHSWMNHYFEGIVFILKWFSNMFIKTCPYLLA